MAAIIEVEGLTKSYGSKRGIANVSFQVDEGDVFGFLGPNGAGKTTTIRLLMALLHADGGAARIAGLDCWKQSLEIKRLVGYLPGEPALDPNLTGGQILEYFANLRGGVDQSYLKQLIHRFDLDTSRKFRQYSTGNKRKVVLIQAFMHRPRLLILDEPTSGLDPLNQQEFDHMVKEARDDERTVFLSSHVLSEVEKTCNRVGIIRDGSIVRIGDVAEVKAIKRYEITITFASAVPAETFKTLEGVAAVVTTPQAREQLISLAQTFAWNADAIAVDTIGGYATFKIGIFIFLIAIWPLLAGSRMLRGEEDRGSMDVLLSLPRPRLRVAMEKLAAMWTALTAMGVLIGLLASAGGAKFGGNFGLGGGLLFGLNLALICAVFGSLALLISQFTQERGPAAGSTAGLLVFFIVLDMVRRDVGGTVPLPRWLRLPERQASRVLPVGDWSLGSVYARSMGMIAMPTFWWTLGIAAFAA